MTKCLLQLIRRMLRGAYLCSILTLNNACTLSRDNAWDQKRCSPGCAEGQICYQGVCQFLDAWPTDGSGPQTEGSLSDLAMEGDSKIASDSLIATDWVRDRDASGTWHHSGFAYRKRLTIKGSGDELVGFPMMLTLNRGAGTDTPGQIYLNGHAAKWTTSIQDILFFNEDGTSLRYWIEKSDSSTATIWLELNRIAPSPQGAAVYLYYGNASATTSSNDSVCSGGVHNGSCYEFWDDFSSSSFNCYENDLTGGCTDTCTTNDTLAICTVSGGFADSPPYAANLASSPPFIKLGGYCGDAGLQKTLAMPVTKSRIDFWASMDGASWGGMAGVALETHHWGPRACNTGWWGTDANLPSNMIHWLAAGTRNGTFSPENQTDPDTGAVYSPLQLTTSWKSYSVDTSQWKGQTITLRLLIMDYHCQFCNYADHYLSLSVDDLGIRKASDPAPTWDSIGPEEAR